MMECRTFAPALASRAASSVELLAGMIGSREPEEISTGRCARSALGGWASGTIARSRTAPASTCGPQQHHCCSDVRAVRIADGDGGFEAISSACGFDEIRELFGTPFDVGLVEDALPQPAKEARHATFKHFAARRK